MLEEIHTRARTNAKNTHTLELLVVQRDGDGVGQTELGQGLDLGVQRGAD